ncbi:MAG: GNAT family N-acetyltransferase [Crocinitomicaceae bacterium]|nr:GNAT family N-acetyltransferase [Crocinitomicaceae bacterium]
MNCVIRPWKLSDLESLVKYANNPAVAKNMTDGFPHPYTKESGEKFLSMAMNAPDRVFAIEVNDEAVGGIGVHPLSDIMRKNAELGYWLAEPFWGKGIVVNAIGQIVPLAFENLDIDRIFARPFGTNLASQRVLEKAGFKFEARFEKTIIKNGVLLDELYYAIRRK